MSQLHNYVARRGGGAASPVNSRPSSRAQAAANAKVRPGDTANYHARQNESDRRDLVSTQPQPQRQPLPQQDRVRPQDVYDTDAGSIDTTIDRSTARFEDFQVHETGQNERFDTEDDTEDTGEDEDDEEDESMQDADLYRNEVNYHHGNIANVPYTAMGDDEIIEQANLQRLTPAEKAEFIQQLRNGALPDGLRVTGDSYPSTTDGEPTEWNEKHETFTAAGDHSAPILQMRHQTQMRQSILRGPSPTIIPATRIIPDSNKILKHGAKLREQERKQSSMRPREGPAHQGHDAAKAANHSAKLNTATSQNHRKADQVNVLPEQGSRPSQPFQTAFPMPAVTSQDNRPSNFAPTPAQGKPFESVMIDEYPRGVSACDYDRDELLNMSYGNLKDESFDKDPRAEPSVLSGDMGSKPLADRLEFVRNNFEGPKQSSFFNSLPTAEWEEAGDWFLDQFSSIIKKTREARQKKRKLAQNFEQEVESRHQHVAKKQQQVEAALSKMKEQGEGLVPRSPRPSRTPRPRRG